MQLQVVCLHRRIKKNGNMLGKWPFLDSIVAIFPHGSFYGGTFMIKIPSAEADEIKCWQLKIL